MNFTKIEIFTSRLDITNRVQSLLTVTEEKTFAEDKLFLSSYTLIVKNFDNFFSGDNSNSVIKNFEYYNEPVWIYDRYNILIWKGNIKKINRIYGSQICEIETVNEMYFSIDKKITYTSSNWEPAAEAIRNIFIENSFTAYNNSVLLNTINKLDENNCYVKVNITDDDSIPLLEATEKLSEYSASDAYTNSNLINISIFKDTGNASKTIRERDMLEQPVIQEIEEEIINNYSISYLGDNGIPASDLNNPSPIGGLSRVKYGPRDMRPVEGAGGDIVTIKDVTAARYIGDKNIRRGHVALSTRPRARRKITTQLKPASKIIVDLEDFLKVEFEPEGWIENNIPNVEVFLKAVNENTGIIGFVGLEIEGTI